MNTARKTESASPPSSRRARWPLLLVLGCTSLRLLAAPPVPLQEILSRTQAVAHVRVTKLAEELKEETVHHHATLSICGLSSGLAPLREFEADIPPPAKTSEKDQPPADPLFAVGDHCIVLLAWRQDHWETLHRLRLAEDGRFMEEEVGTDIGLAPDTSADSVVQLISARITRPAHIKKDRPKPPPTARNQPWNLMRASPLRRVWPFLPR